MQSKQSQRSRWLAHPKAGIDMPALTLKEEWAGLVKQVIDPAGPVSAVQTTEMQRSFYAGALVILTNLRTLAQENITFEQGAQVLVDYEVECAKFFELTMAQMDAEHERAG